MSEEVQNDLLKLSEQICGIIRCIKNCREQNEIRPKLRIKGLIERLRFTFRLARHKQNVSLPLRLTVSKPYLLFECADITPMKKSFLELEEAIREANQFCTRLLGKNGRYEDVLENLKESRILWIIDQHAVTAKQKIEWDIEKGDDLNTIVTRYIWKACNAIEVHKRELEAAGRYLSDVAKNPSHASQYSYKSPRGALDILVVALKDIAFRIRNYRSSRDLCSGYDGLVDVHEFRGAVYKAQNCIERARQIIADPVLADNISVTLKVLLYDDKLMDMFNDVDLWDEAVTNAGAVFKKAAEYCNELENLTARLELACEQENRRDDKGARRDRTKDRPTAVEMGTRNKVVARAAGEIQANHGRLPTVDEIFAETGYSRQQIYSTNAYKDGKIAKSTARLTSEMAGSSVTESEYFGKRSVKHSRAIRRSKSEQDELDALIDEQAKEDKSDFVS